MARVPVTPGVWVAAPLTVRTLLPPEAHTAGRKPHPLTWALVGGLPAQDKGPVHRLLTGFVAWPLLLESRNWEVHSMDIVS